MIGLLISAGTKILVQLAQRGFQFGLVKQVDLERQLLAAGRELADRGQAELFFEELDTRIASANCAVTFLDGMITRLDLLLVRGDTVIFLGENRQEGVGAQPLLGTGFFGTLRRRFHAVILSRRGSKHLNLQTQSAVSGDHASA